MKTTKEIAQGIRKALKSRGWSARQVSVRVRHLGVDSGLAVKVRDAGVPLAEVREIAKSHESVDRDSETGEILLGGNLYVDVDYTSEALEPTKAEILAKLEAADEGELVELENGLKLRRIDRYYWRIDHAKWNRDRVCWGADFAAQQAAEITLGEDVENLYPIAE